MHCSLLASGIFLKVEIKSMTKNVWNQGFADLLTCRLCPSPQPGWVALATQPGLRATQVGVPAKQNMPEGWGSPQNSARENPHRSPETCSTQLGWSLQGTCSQSLEMPCVSVGCLTQVPSEAEEKTRSVTSQFLGYSCSSFTIMAWPCPTPQNAISPWFSDSPTVSCRVL